MVFLKAMESSHGLRVLMVTVLIIKLVTVTVGIGSKVKCTEKEIFIMLKAMYWRSISATACSNYCLKSL